MVDSCLFPLMGVLGLSCSCLFVNLLMVLYVGFWFFVLGW